jgi:hypothetical protein
LEDLFKVIFWGMAGMILGIPQKIMLALSGPTNSICPLYLHVKDSMVDNWGQLSFIKDSVAKQDYSSGSAIETETGQWSLPITSA